MFDTLTKAELYALHTKLHDEGHALHNRFMALPAGAVLSDGAQVMLAKHREISETMRAVYAEIDRREEEARADA